MKIEAKLIHPNQRPTVLAGVLYGWLGACAMSGALVGNVIRRRLTRHSNAHPRVRVN